MLGCLSFNHPTGLCFSCLSSSFFPLPPTFLAFMEWADDMGGQPAALSYVPVQSYSCSLRVFYITLVVDENTCCTLNVLINNFLLIILPCCRCCLRAQVVARARVLNWKMSSSISASDCLGKTFFSTFLLFHKVILPSD